MISQGQGMLLVFFLQLAAGGAFSLLLTPPAERVGNNFYRMMAATYLAAGLIALSVILFSADRAALLQKSLISAKLTNEFGPIIPQAFGVLLILISIVSFIQTRTVKQWVWGILGVVGIVSLLDLAPVFLAEGAPPAVAWFLAGGVLTSALSLGGILSAMMLGHWYLVTPTLSLKPLKTLVVLAGASLLAQLVFLGGGLYATSKGIDADLVRLVVAKPGFDALCFWIRVLVGICGGVVVAILTFRTLDKWRNTQAATGLLYVGVIIVFIGEATGRYLLAYKQLPI
ncbi:MAG: hypothetical protein O3B01_02360 [Planctomycetota bacterium]|nr:hypothetical protein [Planctomycetota bacterium]MDA1137402.1 hypothetical protein [Planctomycetota bacterium]